MYGYEQPRFDNMMMNYQPRPPRYNWVGTPNLRFRAPFNQIYQRQNYFNGPPTSNTEHWCETCDRSFPAADLLEKHLQQHQKCNIDGCQFVAHPKVVTKHIQMQHASGLYKKIANLNNPEEIQKWREERKRKYPTKLNIEKKAAECKEKFDRGEKMGLKSDGHNRNYRTGANKRKSDFKNNQQQKRQRPFIRKNPAVNYEKKVSLPKKIHEVLPAADSLRKLKPFTGIQDIILTCSEEEEKEEIKTHFDIEDDDEYKVPNIETELGKSEPKVCGALSSLMCEYESSEEESLEENIKKDNHLELKNHGNSNGQFDKVMNNSSNDVFQQAKVLNLKINPEKENSNKKYVEKEVTNKKGGTSNDSDNIFKSTVQSDDESGPEEVKISKPNDIKTEKKDDNVTLDNNKITSKKSKLDSFKIKKFNHRKPKLRIPSTLLRKLLHREIQHERNILLQCIRYVVNNDFFDKKVTITERKDAE